MIRYPEYFGWSRYMALNWVCQISMFSKTVFIHISFVRQFPPEFTYWLSLVSLFLPKKTLPTPFPSVCKIHCPPLLHGRRTLHSGTWSAAVADCTRSRKVCVKEARLFFIGTWNDQSYWGFRTWGPWGYPYIMFFFFFMGFSLFEPSINGVPPFMETHIDHAISISILRGQHLEYDWWGELDQD